MAGGSRQGDPKKTEIDRPNGHKNEPLPSFKGRALLSGEAMGYRA